MVVAAEGSGVMRHLPPTAAPLSWAAWRRGWAALAQPRPAAVAQLATDWQRYLGSGPCFLADSGRAALFGLLRAMAGERPSRRELIIPAYTCPALVSVTLAAGLQPRLVDISPQTLALDEPQLAATLSAATLAVIVVHPFGLPQPLQDVVRRAQAAGAWLIEDAAQALGARWDGRPAGVRGDAGLFSLGPGKPLSTGGGGFVCLNHPALASAAAVEWAGQPQPGRPAAAAALLRLAIFHLAFRPRGWWLAARLGAQRVGDSEASWGYRWRGLTAGQAAVARALLPGLDAANAARRRNGQRIQAALAGVSGFHIPPTPPEGDAIYLRLPLIADEPARREWAYGRLQAAGIGAGRMYGRSLPAIFPELAGQFPGAEAVARRLLTLPTHHYLTAADVDRIGRLLAS